MISRYVMKPLWKRVLTVSLVLGIGITTLKSWSESIEQHPITHYYLMDNIVGSPSQMAQEKVGFYSPNITAQQSKETGAASLYINQNEVIRLQDGSKSLSALARTQAVQHRLNQFLAQGGAVREILPGLQSGQAVVRAGQMVLVTVDSKTAKQSGLTDRQLAYEWANMIRHALGAPTMSRDESMIASRGFSPAVSVLREHLREAPALQAALMAQRQKIAAHRPKKPVQRGYASWYGPGFKGHRCSNGERFNPASLTAAHRTLPFGTKVRVTNVRSGRSTIVRITDRGPFVRGRIIDLSRNAARAIGMLSSGTAPVILEVLGR